jgi:hypothetical protein
MTFKEKPMSKFNVTREIQKKRQNKANIDSRIFYDKIKHDLP